MWIRLFALLIFGLPWVFRPNLDNILFVSTQCPACYHRIVQLKNKGLSPRLWVMKQPLEINCLMGKIYEMAPEKQELFLEFIRKNPEKLSLSLFCETSQIDKPQLLPCKNCVFYQLSVNEILYYVMSIFISTVPYGAENR